MVGTHIEFLRSTFESLAEFVQVHYQKACCRPPIPELSKDGGNRKIVFDAGFAGYYIKPTFDRPEAA